MLTARRSNPFVVVVAYLLLFRCVQSFSWPWQNDDDDDSNDSNDSNENDEDEDDDTFFGIGSNDERNPYQPYTTTCPSSYMLREAANMSSRESDYIQKRHAKTNENLAKFLDEVAQLSDFNATKFIDHYAPLHNISIGLAFSGGGYRAMLTGAGEMAALDSRYSPANSKALGGLLQSSTYMAGLSGGGWLLGSLIFNGWISVEDILNGKVDIWNLDDTIFNPNGINLIKTAQYYLNIGKGISAKNDYFETTIADIWGRAVAYQLLPDKGGENLTWSGITNISAFEDHEMPFPLLLANGRDPGTAIVNLNSTVYEFSPYEFGSWDPSINSFIDTEYLGTYLDNGEPNDTDSCVVNYDNAGFLMGTSSSIFNQFITKLETSDMNKYLKSIVKRLLGLVIRGENDIALYDPNPFYNSDYGTSDIVLTNHSLNLVDGGSDDQNIPFHPLIQPKRDVDVIFAFDNSGDTTTEWPNGSALIHTFKRQFGTQGKGSPVPFVPDTYESFIDSGADQTPTFFGCNASTLDDLVMFHDNDDINSTDVPLIIYIPNAYMSYYSNTSTTKLDYDDDEKWAIIQNGFEVASANNLTDDRQWPTCVGCAILRRTQERFNIDQSRECQRCFEKYCWEPSKDDAAYSSISAAAEMISKSTDTATKTKSLKTNTATSTVTPTTTAGSSTTSRASRSEDGSAPTVLPWLMPSLSMLLYTLF